MSYVIGSQSKMGVANLNYSAGKRWNIDIDGKFQGKQMIVSAFASRMTQIQVFSMTQLVHIFSYVI